MSEPKILIVEDEETTALNLKEIIENFGYEVCGIAVSGETALELAEQDTPELVLMDITLKGDMDGIQATQQLMKKYNVPVLFITGNVDVTTIEKAMATGPYGILQKPFGSSILFMMMDNALKRSEFLEKEHLESIIDPVEKREHVRQEPDPSNPEELTIIHSGRNIKTILIDLSYEGASFLLNDYNEGTLEVGEVYGGNLILAPDFGTIDFQGTICYTYYYDTYINYGMKFSLSETSSKILSRYIDSKMSGD
jgi:DNA-binding NarL/FixJ family response regulator